MKILTTLFDTLANQFLIEFEARAPKLIQFTNVENGVRSFPRVENNFEIPKIYLIINAKAGRVDGEVKFFKKGRAKSTARSSRISKFKILNLPKKKTRIVCSTV